MALPLPERVTGNLLTEFVDAPTQTTAAPLFTKPVKGPGDAGEQGFEKEEYPPETENVRRETSKDDLQKGPWDIGDVFIGPFCRQYHLPLCLIYARINQKTIHRDAIYLNICAIIPARKQRKNPKKPKLNSIFTVP